MPDKILVEFGLHKTIKGLSKCRGCGVGKRVEGVVWVRGQRVEEGGM